MRFKESTTLRGQHYVGQGSQKTEDANAVLIIGQRRRRWANINTTLAQGLMLAGL